MPSAQRAPPPASIRPYDHPTDYKFLRFLIGSSILSKTATANQALFWSNPLVYLWTVCFTVYTSLQTFSSGSAGTANGSLAVKLVSRLPLFVAPPLVLLLLLNWCHRNHFNVLLAQTLRREDLRDPARYYKRERSGIWVLDYDGRQLGMIALDSHDLGGMPGDKATTLIRHLASSFDFRAAGIDHDLLTHILPLVFRARLPADILAIRIMPTLAADLLATLSQLGFHRMAVADAFAHRATSLSDKILALLGWPNCQSTWPEEIYTLERERWLASNPAGEN